MTIEFFVPGTPKAAGSKRGFAFRRKNGKLGVAMTDDTGLPGKEWRSDVKKFASDVHAGRPLLDSAIRLTLTFILRRPQCHYGSGKNAATLKPSAPRFHLQKPDVLKLARSVEDALTGVVWTDDCLIVSEVLAKDWGAQPGVRIRIDTVGEYIDQVVIFGAAAQ